MAVSPLEVFSVARALKDGVLLIEDLIALAAPDADLTLDKAELSINKEIQEKISLRDNETDELLAQADNM